jgi:hypothetical protein
MVEEGAVEFFPCAHVMNRQQYTSTNETFVCRGMRYKVS